MADTVFDKGTPDEIKNVLNRYTHARKAVRLFYGDAKTGRDWGDEYGVIGCIGRSTGSKPCALLIANARSMGGPAILTACIVKLIDCKTREVLYKHSNYHQPIYTVGKKEGFTATVYANGDKIANFKNPDQAKRWIAFMKGERMVK